MSKDKLAVIGASSMVGSRFCEQASTFELIKADLSGQIQVDITKQKSVEDFFKNHQFDWIILFSAFTDVDAAEEERGDKSGLCHKINVEGTQNVIDSCVKFRRNLIFISTDFVFDGTAGPYSETDPPGPDHQKLSWYGLTKLEAEKQIIDKVKNFIILRISYPFRAGFATKDDLPKRILRLYRQHKLYPLFSDQIITPTFIDDVASAIELLVAKNQRGIFHLASPQTTTQYDFARELIKVFDGNLQGLKKGSIKEFLKKKGSTPRPIKGGLKVEKITGVGFTPTTWQDGIYKIYQQSGGQLL